MTKTITYAQFERVLMELGFKKTVIPKSHILYEHLPTDTSILAKLHKPNEDVPWHLMASSRRILDGRGVVEADEFDDMLQKAAA